MSGSIPVQIYTDGASTGNPGPGGYGIVMISGQHRKEFSAGYRKTTNNRMELLAVIEGLRKLRRDDLKVSIYSDSKYVVDAIEKGWVFNWQRKGFKDKKNPDLWREYLPLHQRFQPKMVWVKGHAGHPLNERCDELATGAARNPELLIDHGYEKSAG